MNKYNAPKKQRQDKQGHVKPHQNDFKIPRTRFYLLDDRIFTTYTKRRKYQKQLDIVFKTKLIIIKNDKLCEIM